ncbi:MAG: 5-nucleotidase [Rhodospirillales bacterium]|jgi:putative hydrolase of HD superfamily|nr:5-nucleotidase [Rhodospirillales bacterium]
MRLSGASVMDPAGIDRLSQQIGFILEIDKLKTVLRQTLLIDQSRRENTAEHSWHLAMMAITLADYAERPVDIGRVIRMLLVHDLVEIDAGDTFVYDVAANLDKAAREAEAAERIFGLLPPDQGTELRSLWQEFEARQTPDAAFAAALDRLQPLLHNYHTEGSTWRQHGITVEQVIMRNRSIAEGSQRLWAYTERLIEDAVAHGFLAPGASEPESGDSGHFQMQPNR